MAQPDQTAIDVNGRQTFLSRVGAGNREAVLFIHGSGPGAGGWSNWQFALPAVGEQYDALAPDLIGYGRSTHPDNPPSGAKAWLEVWVKQMIGLLDHLGHEKASVVGNSMGGAILLHLLVRYPERVNKAVFMGTIGTPHTITDRLDKLWGFYDDPSPERMAQALRWFVWDPAAVGGDLDEIAKMRFRAAMDPGVRRSYASMFSAPRQRHADDLVVSDEQIGRITNPALIIHGRDDGIVPLETSLYLLPRMSNVQMHVYGQCSHWTMIEHRDSFNRLLMDFLTEAI